MVDISQETTSGGGRLDQTFVSSEMLYVVSSCTGLYMWKVYKWHYVSIDEKAHQQNQGSDYHISLCKYY